jgi:hypothetical protein
MALPAKRIDERSAMAVTTVESTVTTADCQWVVVVDELQAAAAVVYSFCCSTIR